MRGALVAASPNVRHRETLPERRHSSFRPRHVIVDEEHEEEDETWSEWFFTFQQAPCQLTAYVAPATLLVRCLFVAVLYLLLLRMCPIPAVATSVQGVQRFVELTEFNTDGITRPVEAQDAGPALIHHSHRRLRSSLLADGKPGGGGGRGKRKQEGGSASFEEVKSLDDVAYFTEALVQRLFPVEAYDGARPEDERLLVLRVHRLLSSVVLLQRRVKPTDCAYDSLKSFYPVCYEELHEQNEDTGIFLGHQYDPVLGGLAVTLPLDRDEALQKVREIAAQNWWDQATRESSLLFLFHNAPGHYTGYCRVTFALSPYGSVKSDIEVAFLRLQPFAAEVHGYLLILWSVLAAVFLCLILYEIVHLSRQQVHTRWALAYLLRPWAVFDYCMLVLVGLGTYAWLDFVGNPARSNISPETGAPSFTDLAAMAVQFSEITFFLSTVLLFAVFRIVEYLTMMPEVGAMYHVLARAVSDMGYFIAIFVTMFVGFTLGGHVLFGQQVPMFASVASAMNHLMLWFLTLGEGHEDLFEQPGGFLYMCFFMVAIMVMLFNMLIGIVTNAFDTVAEEEKHRILIKPVNHKLADWLCDRAGVSPFYDDPYNLPDPPQTVRTAAQTPHAHQNESQTPSEYPASAVHRAADWRDPAFAQDREGLPPAPR